MLSTLLSRSCCPHRCPSTLHLLDHRWRMVGRRQCKCATIGGWVEILVIRYLCERCGDRRFVQATDPDVVWRLDLPVPAPAEEEAQK
jgi:hypothetical protein